MAEWDAVGPTEPLRLTVHPAPKDGMTPAPPTGWAVKDTAPVGMAKQQGGGDTSDPAPSGGWLAKAIEPITSLPSTYMQMNREAREKMSQGVEQLGTPGERLKGGWNVATGALDFGMSPINAPVRTLVGKPVEDITGIPKEYTEFATTLALPGVGLASYGKARDALKPLENIVSPTTVSPIAGEAESSIRSATGAGARDTATTEAALEPFHAKINALPEADRLNFLDYVESRSTKYSGMVMKDPELHALGDSLKTAFDSRMQKLQAMPGTAQAQFIEDYFPHFWKDPAKATSASRDFGGGVGKQGSRASLNKRTVPTIADGIAMGLEPSTTNPMEAAMQYVRSMDHFIASQEVLYAAQAQGTVRYIKPKTMGASGHPDSFRVPDGWVPIKGRGATRGDGAQAYAPEDWARVYNNFIDRGIHKNADWGKMYDAAQMTSNAITSLELGLSGYHAFTMANEAIISDVAKGISEIVGGKPIKAIGTLAKAPVAPIRLAHRGKKVERVYLGLTQATPDFSKIVDLLEKAGGRAVGAGHAADYKYSAMGSYWTAYKRGALKQQMQQSLATAKTGPVAAGIEGGKQIGRIMQTVAQPLFEKYIPRIKNGAFFDTMQSWLDTHPGATQVEQVKAARQIWDSIDNRFGEMVQDNIFWNKTMKQAAQLGMRSYSWNLGTVREIGGGVKDIVNKVGHGDEWTPRASYTVALPIVVGTMNAAYQYLMTGKSPESVDDLVAGRTGGTAPGFGSRGEVPERVSLPGYQKDVFGWYHDWRQEAANKVATGPRALVVDPLRDADWRGDPIFHSGNSGLQDYFNHVLQSVGPISLKQLVEGKKEGSNIGWVQRAMGARPAPAIMQDPEGTTRGLKAMHDQRERREKNYQRKQQRLYEE